MRFETLKRACFIYQILVYFMYEKKIIIITPI